MNYQSTPLAERLRPTSLDQYIGQEHLVGENAVLRRAIESGRIPSMIFWGPPGVGKTTLASIISKQVKRQFYVLNAVSSGVKEVREVFDRARMAPDTPILFIDEIHRFSKSQQDSLLNAVEKGLVILIGATTENPYFEVNGALISRSSVFELQPLSIEDVKTLLKRAVYDVEKGMWHKEDDLKAECFCAVDDEVYYISDGSIRTLFGSGTKDTEKIKWMAETGDLGVDAPDKKYISRLSVRLSMDIGTRVYISIKYDSSGGWERICSLTGNTLRTFTLPIKPKRCDHLKLKFEGEGDAKIYAISKTVEIGSDV